VLPSLQLRKAGIALASRLGPLGEQRVDVRGYPGDVRRCHTRILPILSVLCDRGVALGIGIDVLEHPYLCPSLLDIPIKALDHRVEGVDLVKSASCHRRRLLHRDRATRTDSLGSLDGQAGMAEW
jgi:hypothetical protein